MTSLSLSVNNRRHIPLLEPALLLAGLAGAVLARRSFAGPAGAASVRAGLLFALLLAALSVASGVRVVADRRSLALGVLGAGVLVAPVLVSHAVTGRPLVHPGAGYAGWALATAVVATAEEAFLRGALFSALLRLRGDALAVVGAAVAFAALHVPLYGWRVLPLDLAVGLGLGALRLVSGGWAAPALAHTGADLAGWWLL